MKFNKILMCNIVFVTSLGISFASGPDEEIEESVTLQGVKFDVLHHKYEESELTHQMKCDEYGEDYDFLKLTVNGTSSMISCDIDGSKLVPPDGLDPDPDPDPTGPDPEPDPTGPDPDPTGPISITQTTQTEYDCATYTKGYHEKWGNCKVKGDWTEDGKIKCVQESDYEGLTAPCGQMEVTITKYFDGNGDLIGTDRNEGDCTGCPGDKKKPKSKENDVIIKLVHDKFECIGSSFANNSDKCGSKFKIDLSGLKDPGLVDIEGLAGIGITNIKNETKEPADIKSAYDPDDNSALNFSDVIDTQIRGSSTNFGFRISDIKAISPFKTTNGKISFDIENVDVPGKTNVTLDNINYSFNKPFTGSLSIDPNGIRVGQAQELTLHYATGTDILDFGDDEEIEYFGNTLKVNGTGYALVTTGFDSRDTDLEMVVNYDGGNIDGDPRLTTDPYIFYTVDGKDVRYRLSDGNEPNDRRVTYIPTNTSYLNIKIIGQSQTVGRQDVTGQAQNFSSMSTSNFRNSFRRKVLEYTRGWEYDDNKDGVLYLDGEGDTIEYSSISDTFETLIIRNGNLLIDEDINHMKGIVVIRDDVREDTLGNIFVNQDVQEINAYIYGDGGLISFDKDENDSYNNYSDSFKRRENLENQLVLEGRLYTRNTVGGAIGAGKYMLPGAKETTDYHRALMYDLNQFRSGRGSSPVDSNYTEAFIIKYHTGQSPKLFE
ncbi:hypothetical protein [Candidatus Vampirococcus lugosii]|uniref:Uncharacterized protein n=1 Tax=Candidatus Vampirococcus lugosii TaxID=2789015 RepID=A0ABS5QMP6_9BACT|nr:hypothetical protein [Candidatus Vampirococcus lugosii]MBS8121971.1 hypothetical protein [Candidatus Vampirococcus lugosii]